MAEKKKFMKDFPDPPGWLQIRKRLLEVYFRSKDLKVVGLVAAFLNNRYFYSGLRSKADFPEMSDVDAALARFGFQRIRSRFSLGTNNSQAVYFLDYDEELIPKDAPPLPEPDTEPLCFEDPEESEVNEEQLNCGQPASMQACYTPCWAKYTCPAALATLPRRRLNTKVIVR